MEEGLEDMKKTSRRRFMTKGAAAGAVAVAATAPVKAQGSPQKKVLWRDGKKPDKTPRFSPAVSYGNLLFISGAGYHQEGDIKKHTDEVLKTIQEELERCGSSMNKCLKCNVYLNDLKDYAAMNEVFQGRFGDEPPVRTTIAAAGGIPGNSLVEIDVIAYI
jgi:enamine deaminase RidA (YjgF/YER057c/UK114 family)